MNLNGRPEDDNPNDPTGAREAMTVMGGLQPTNRWAAFKDDHQMRPLGLTDADAVLRAKPDVSHPVNRAALQRVTAARASKGSVVVR